MPFIITNEKIIIILCFQETSQNPKAAGNIIRNGEQLRSGPS